MKIYKGRIVPYADLYDLENTILPNNGVFVFGSNCQGRHGKGSAKIAKDYFGAVYGNAQGHYGKSYAIITKDLRKSEHPSITKEQIEHQIEHLYEYAKENPQLDFYVAYTGKGTNLNGYSNQQMAYMFSGIEIPDNIVFEEEFYKIVNILYVRRNKKTNNTE